MVALGTEIDLPCPAPPPDLNLACRCGATTFRTSWQTFRNGTKHVRMDCAACGRFIRYLKQPGGPEPRLELPPSDLPDHRRWSPTPEESWEWIGLHRGVDGLWRPVALAPTLERCWDCLLSFPSEGDLLAIPSLRAARKGKGGGA
jgi:hypothetical protein